MSKSKTSKGVVARRRQDPRNSSVTIVEFVPAPKGKPKGEVRTCSECGKPFTVRDPNIVQTLCSECLEKPKKEAEKALQLQQLEREKKMEGAVHLNCITCGKHFYITKSKQEKLKSLGIPLYTECYACQQAKLQTTEKEVTK